MDTYRTSERFIQRRNRRWLGFLTWRDSSSGYRHHIAHMCRLFSCIFPSKLFSRLENLPSAKVFQIPTLSMLMRMALRPVSKMVARFWPTTLYSRLSLMDRSIQKIHRAWGQIRNHQIPWQDCDPRLYILDPDRQQDPQKLEAACCHPATQSSHGSSIIKAGWDYQKTHYGHLSSSPSAELPLKPIRPLPCPRIRPVIQHLITTTLQLNWYEKEEEKEGDNQIWFWLLSTLRLRPWQPPWHDITFSYLSGGRSWA